MQDQLSNRAEERITSQSTPQLQRITYLDNNRNPRQKDENNPTIKEAATDMEQHYLPLERLHNVGLHGWGIAAGLQVAFTPHQTGVTVRQGIALDNNGLHILLVSGGLADISLQSDGPGTDPLAPVGDQGVLVPTDGLTGAQYLVIRFLETVDTTNFCTHTPWVHFVAPADLPIDGSSLILAQVAFDNAPNQGQVLTVLQGPRQGTGGHVERAYDFNIQRPAVLAGLTVSATLNSPGITVSPGLALNAVGRYVLLNSGGQAEVGHNADAPGATPTLVDVSGDGVSLSTTDYTGQKYLTIQPWETLTTTFTLPVPPNTLQTAPMRFRYTPRLQLVDPSNFTFNGANVILARITFGSGGVVTSMSADVRPDSALSAGSFQVLKNMTTSPSEDSQSVSTEGAGAIVPMSNGLALTVFAAEDEIHLNAASVQTSGDLVVNGSFTGSGDVTVENALVNGGLNVGGGIVANGLITTAANVQGDVTASGSLFVTGSITANEGVTTTRAIEANQLSADQAVHVGGGLFNGSIDIHQVINPIPAISLTTDNSGGSIIVNGTITKKGGGFSIDHPLDQEHKTLSHSFVESPDMKNLYDGIALLDVKGEATIELPEWFTALNGDIRYQLTCIGDYAPIYIAREVQDNRFTIAGGRPEMKVSWQVTGIRQDTWARKNRIKVEEDKQPNKQPGIPTTSEKV